MKRKKRTIETEILTDGKGADTAMRCTGRQRAGDFPLPGLVQIQFFAHNIMTGTV